MRTGGIFVFISQEFWKNLVSLSRLFAASTDSQIQVAKIQSAFHRRAQRNGFRRRDVRRQSRSFAGWSQSLNPAIFLRELFENGELWLEKAEAAKRPQSLAKL